MVIIYCPNCGKEITNKDKFCSNCGENLSKYNINKDETNNESKNNDEDLNFEDQDVEFDDNTLTSNVKKEKNKNNSGGCLKVFMVTIVVFSIIFVLLALGSTGDYNNQQAAFDNKEEQSVQNEKQNLNVFIEPNIHAQNNKLIIEGNTNLIDGALITYSVRVENLDDITWEMTEDEEMKKRLDLKMASMTSGDLKVEDGKFRKEIDISKFVDGNLIVNIGFHHFEQPQKVIDKYGKYNQFIKGENVFEKKSLQNENQMTKSIERSYRVTFN